MRSRFIISDPVTLCSEIPLCVYLCVCVLVGLSLSSFFVAMMKFRYCFTCIISSNSSCNLRGKFSFHPQSYRGGK